MEAYAASYAASFRPRLHGQLARCQQYIKGLLHACRSNVARINERLPDSTHDALHRFGSVSDWDGLAVMDGVARRVQATLGEVAGGQGLLLAECGWEKAGTKSVGVGRQYVGQVGKTSNGQGGVFAVLSRGTSAGPAGGQLDLPGAWSSEAARCAQARVPLAAQAYRSKPALAAASVEHLLSQGLVRADWVGATRPTATRRPCAKPCSSAGKPTCSTWGRARAVPRGGPATCYCLAASK